MYIYIYVLVECIQNSLVVRTKRLASQKLALHACKMPKTKYCTAKTHFPSINIWPVAMLLAYTRLQINATPCTPRSCK